MRLPVLGLEKITENKKRKPPEKRKKDKKYRNQVVIPYVGVSERVDRVLKKYGVTTAMRPHTTLRRLSVHPKDKVEQEQGELFYQILCKSCGAAYIKETGRLFKTRLNEHKKENVQKEQYMGSGKKQLQSTTNKSDLTITNNHLIDWKGIQEVESHRRRRHVKEAIRIRKTKAAINQDEGNYELPHMYDAIRCH